MIDIDIEKAKNEFMKYTDNYDSSNPHINRKIYHSLRVMEWSKKIAENSNLNNEQIELATLIGLLHDIGRFEQRKIYNTFSDKLSTDHGNLGVEILEKDNFIRKFIETDKYDKIIKIAIKNHNKYEIQEGLTEEELLQSKIIRDADKLDIFYEATEIFWDSEEDKEKIEKSFISEDYFEQFKNNKPIYRRPDQTKLDEIISLIAFMFDMNFEYSLNVIKNEKYVDVILKRFNYKNESTKNQIEQIRIIADEYLSK